MNPGEHEVMARIEDELWWYRGLRDVIARTLETAGALDVEGPRVLDAGCGTGRNLAALDALLAPSHLAGFDLSEEALRFAREKAPRAEITEGDLSDPPLPEGDLDVVTSLDVMCIPGTERVLPGLRKLVGALRPGGLLVLNVPAYDWLFSEHDVAVHTSERYTTRRIGALLDTLGLEPHVLTYRLCLLFPVVVAARLPSILRRPTADPEARSDLHSAPSRPVNEALFGVLRAENALIASGVSLPFGSSVFAVGRKPKGA